MRSPVRNTISRSIVLAVALSAGLASNAFADKITLTGHGDYRTGLGGEFNIRAATGDAGGAALLAQILSAGYFGGPLDVAGTADGTKMKADATAAVGFQTFCLEYGETINLGSTYDAQLSIGAINGGAGATDPDGAGPLPSMDRISLGTAYLYSLFATGDLALHGYIYDNTSTRETSAALLQNAFWFFEDERSALQIGANSFVDLAVAKFGGETNAKADNNFYSVGVLNLSNGSTQHQSQLTMRVPDRAVTVVLLSFAFSGLALLRRRFD